MSQINKQSKRKRPIRRKQGISPYPASKCQDGSSIIDNNAPCATAPPLPQTVVSQYPDLAKDIPGTEALVSQVNDYMRNVKRTYVLGDNDNASIQEGLSDLNPSDNSTLAAHDDQNALTSSAS